MNRRILKKLSKRAVADLARRGVECVPADGDETIDVSKKFDLKHCRSRNKRSGYAYPLKGTPMVWRRTSWEYNEWDCRTAYDELQHYLFVENFDWKSAAEEFEREWLAAQALKAQQGMPI